MASFRINNNIPKTIVTPQIKTLNIPFTTQVSGTNPDPDETFIGNIPYNISILGCTATIINQDLDYKKIIKFSIKIDSQDLSGITCNITIPANELNGSCIATKNVNEDKQNKVYVLAIKESNVGLVLTGTFTINYFQM